MSHDANGKVTPVEHGRRFVYDARHRLVEVSDASGGTIARYT